MPQHNALRTLLLTLSFASMAILAAALVSQYWFGLAPCHLCLLQRYPYAAIIAIGLPAAFFVSSPNILRYVLGVCVLLLLADAGIAAYHAGVELGWFPGPGGCTVSNQGEQTLEEMRAALLNAPLVSCDQAMASFLGLSMAAWNALAALGLALFTLAMLWPLRRVKKT